MADEEPDYKVYRSRPRLLRRRDEASGGARGLDELRAPDAPPPERPTTRSSAAAAARGCPRCRGRARACRAASSPGRVVKWLLIALVGWLALSAALFMLSAQIQRGDLAEQGRRRSSIPARTR